MKRILIFFVLLLSANLAVFAQTDDEPLPNDPTVNENANACLDGGVMAGKCNIDLDGDGVPDEDAVSWAWDCGWYLIRFNYGILSREGFPPHCSSLLPPKPPEPDGNVCYTNGFESFYLAGPLQTLNNAALFNTMNCTGPSVTGSSGDFSILSAPDPMAAVSICIGMGGFFMFNLSSDLGFNTPPTWYVCLI